MNYREHEVSRDHKSVLPPGGCGNKQKRPHSSQTQKSVRHTAKPPKKGTRCKPKSQISGVQGEPKSKRQAKTKPNIKTLNPLLP